MTPNTKQLHATATEVAKWMEYLLDANPGLGRMCRSDIRFSDDGVAATEARSMQSDYDALMEALEHFAPGERGGDHVP